jgi:orotate phosphoribosyltransferase
MSEPQVHSALARAVYEKAHLTGEFLLRSGATSHEYFDKYLFESDPVLLRSLAEAMAPMVPPGTEALAGLELGGVPLATMLSQVTGLPVLFVRKKAKDYGTCRLAEGGDVAGRRLVIVEDVVTSGGQVVLSAADLRAEGAEVSTVLCVIDREAGGREALGVVELELKQLFTLSQLGGNAAER